MKLPNYLKANDSDLYVLRKQISPLCDILIALFFLYSISFDSLGYL